MKTFLKALLAGVSFATALAWLHAEEKRPHLGEEARLLEDAGRLFERPVSFQSRMDLTRFLDESFRLEMAEAEVRKNVFARLQHFEAASQTAVAAHVSKNHLVLTLSRIDDLLPENGGPSRWDLSITFDFDSAHRLKSCGHTVTIGHYGAPLDQEAEKVPNQPSQPSPRRG